MSFALQLTTNDCSYRRNEAKKTVSCKDALKAHNYDKLLGEKNNEC
jgi:hypothetical protein